ncbi:Mitochondrial inner membrane magnesium transporter LPE10 Flags: Precursor [Serendipita indica DSM 11827]|nr:Mitochondrial inner membrane magnesium transporter LPE10 Flags: Precursor [Serendipita indica DSM 11827]
MSVARLRLGLCLHTRSFTSSAPCLFYHSTQNKWIGRWNYLRRRREDANDEDSAARENEEEAAKSAILEKSFESRQPTDLMLRCTVLDSAGVVKTISGSFKKSDLASEHKLNPRDLRKIDSRIPNLVPTILVRKEAFLVNILHIRALIKADTVLLFDTYGSADSRLHSMFLYHLEHNLKKAPSNSSSSSSSTSMPYEFRALESVLLSVLSALESEMVFTRHLVGGLLAELEDDIDRDKFKRLLHYSRRLSNFQNRAKLVQAAIDEVLEQDEDMDAMYLSDKKKGIIKEEPDHEELEVLLESFSKQVEEIVNESETTMANISSTQEIVELILDANRNNLLALDLKVSIATMGLGAGALFAGLFGMNLRNEMEESVLAFGTASSIAVGLAIVLAWAGMRKLDRIRRVGLSMNHSKRADRISVPIRTSLSRREPPL